MFTMRAAVHYLSVALQNTKVEVGEGDLHVKVLLSPPCGAAQRAHWLISELHWTEISEILHLRGWHLPVGRHHSG
jgi:hypothetical protein